MKNKNPCEECIVQASCKKKCGKFNSWKSREIIRIKNGDFKTDIAIVGVGLFLINAIAKLF